jgi:hypothetical protein
MGVPANIFYNLGLVTPSSNKVSNVGGEQKVATTTIEKTARPHRKVFFTFLGCIVVL